MNSFAVNNVSIISGRFILWTNKTGVLGENHRQRSLIGQEHNDTGYRLCQEHNDTGYRLAPKHLLVDIGAHCVYLYAQLHVNENLFI